MIIKQKCIVIMPDLLTTIKVLFFIYGMFLFWMGVPSNKN